MFGEEGEKYKKEKLEHGKQLLKSVDSDKKTKPGGGGCHWEKGSDPSKVKCAVTNPGNDAYIGWAQPKNSPLHTNKPGSAMTSISEPPASFNNKRAISFLA